MKTSRELATAGLILLCFANFLHAAEPAFKGKPLSRWLKDLHNNPATSDYQPAEEAIRQMGTNVIPHLLRLLADDTINAPDHQLVVNAFHALGSRASNAAPALAELLLKPASSGHAARALVAIGAESRVLPLLSHTNKPMRTQAILALGSSTVGKEAIPPLLGLFADPDEQTRAYAILTTGHIGKEPALAVPAIIQSLNDPAPYVRGTAAMSLGFYDKYPDRIAPLSIRVTVPALIKALSDADAQVRINAARTLGGLLSACEPAVRKTIVTALLRTLDDPDQWVKHAAIWALGTPLPEAQEAFPRLLEIAKGDGSKELKNVARASVLHIDRTAALKAGIE
jgi:HEAT repeat protein